MTSSLETAAQKVDLAQDEAYKVSSSRASYADAASWWDAMAQASLGLAAAYGELRSALVTDLSLTEPVRSALVSAASEAERSHRAQAQRDAADAARVRGER